MEVVHLVVVLDRLSRATTKKVVDFFERKVQPRQNPGYAYVGHILWMDDDTRYNSCTGRRALHHQVRNCSVAPHCSVR